MNAPHFKNRNAKQNKKMKKMREGIPVFVVNIDMDGASHGCTIINGPSGPPSFLDDLHNELKQVELVIIKKKPTCF